jgi:hypothetical protein
VLGPLANNGGPTQTHDLLPGSAAIDAVLPAGPSGVSTDQRGVLRPQGPSCDIGAFEVEAGSITIDKVAKGGAAYRVFTFRFDDLKFRLGDGQSETFDNLPADDNVVSEDEAHGFFLQDLVCRDGQSTFDYDPDDRQVTIHLAPGEDVECTHEREGFGTRHPDAREPHRGSAVRRVGRPGG